MLRSKNNNLIWNGSGPRLETGHPVIGYFVCTMATGHPNPQEHDTVAWFTPEKLCTLDWAAADVPVLSAYLAARRKDAP